MYDKYEKKVIKIAKVRGKIYRNRILIMTIFGLAFTSSTTLVATKGLVSDKILLNNTYTYGETLNFASSAFLAETEYEFARLESDDWSPVLPRLVGKYKMRGRAENSFDSYYYGAEQKFEIIPKYISVTPFEDEITYGVVPTININDLLEYGDSLTKTYDFTYGPKETATWNINVDRDSLVITNLEGKDVTNCYTFLTPTKEVKINKRSISVTSVSATKTYDGTALMNEGFSIVSGSLVPGDVLKVNRRTSITNYGKVANDLGYYVENEDGIDMSIHYNISDVKGLLNITKRPITFKSASFEYEYDGTPKHFEVSDILLSSAADSLLPGHTASFVIGDEPGIKAGTHINTFSAKISENGIDVSENYAISYEFGKTIINRRPISVRANSLTKTYDKKPVAVKTYEITKGELALKDEITSISAPTFTESGVYENKHTFQITDIKSGLDFSDSYVITRESGEINIKKIDLNINIVAEMFMYDGKAHTNKIEYDEAILAVEDEVRITQNIEKTLVGDYDNNELNVDIISADGLSNAHNYNINITGRENALKVLKRELEITLLAKDKVYDAKPILNTLDEDEEMYEITGGSLANGEVIEYEINNNPTDAGEYPISASFVIYRQNEEENGTTTEIETTANYDIKVISANFDIKKRDLIITTLDSEHEYNRDTRIPKDTILYSLSGNNLVLGHKIETLDITFSGINVGTYGYDIDEASLKVVDEDGVDVTENYNPIYINSGTRTITPRRATLTMEENFKVYDGTPFSSDTYTSERLLDGDYVTFEELSEVTYVTEGRIKNPNENTRFFVFTILDEDVSQNYELSVTEGDIYIKPRKITVTSESVTKTFDGKVIGDTELIVTDGSLAPGDEIVIINQASRLTKNTFHSGKNDFSFYIENKNGVDMTLNYEITMEFGELLILPCPIEIDIFDKVVMYDGNYHGRFSEQTLVTPLSDEIYIAGGAMPENYTLSVRLSDNTTSSQINAGVYTYSEHYNFNFSVYTTIGEPAYREDFAITFPTDILKIEKRSLTLQSVSGSKQFDRLPFDQTVTIISGELAPGDAIYFDEIDGVIEVGVDIDNPIGEVSIYNINGDDVTENYDLHLIYGKVTIYERF